MLASVRYPPARDATIPAPVTRDFTHTRHNLGAGAFAGLITHPSSPNAVQGAPAPITQGRTPHAADAQTIRIDGQRPHTARSCSASAILRAEAPSFRFRTLAAPPDCDAG